MIRGLVTAIRTLTSLPIPGRDTENRASALPWFPVVGLLLGLICFAVALLLDPLSLYDWQGGTALAVLLAGILLTRALHLDGLADWVDGFWGGQDRESILRIMKDSSTGAFGTVAISFTLLAKWVCILELIRYDRIDWIIVAFIISRTAMVDLAVSRKYARSEGGTGASFIEGASHKHLSAAIVAAVLLMSLLFMATSTSWLSALLTGLLVSRLFGLYAERRIGGITGDLLGACSEIVEITVLAMGAAMSHWSIASLLVI